VAADTAEIVLAAVAAAAYDAVVIYGMTIALVPDVLVLGHLTKAKDPKMTTRRSFFLTLGAAALVLAIAVPVAFSHGPGPGGRDGDGPRGDRIERLVEKLGLDATQKAKLEKLKTAHQADAQALREQIQSIRDETKALWLAANPDKAKILGAERQVQAIQGKLAESRVEFMFAARGVLTAEQFKKFVEMRKGHGGRHGHGACGSDGPDKGGPPAPDDE